MPATNRGCAVVAAKLVSDPGIKAMLVKPAYSFSRTHNTVSDVVANEVSGTNYVGGFGGAGRKVAASRVVVEDDANNRAEFSAASFTWTQINVGVVGGMVLFKEGTTDADSDYLFFYDLTGGAGTVTNGGDLVVVPDAEGLVQVSSV
jgi:hypothetical protein